MIPDYDQLYSIAVDALPFDISAAIRVLDLGCGTGGFSVEIANKYPNCTIRLSDISQNMLDKAREKFSGDSRCSFVVEDCLAGDYGGPYDAIVSSLMIHHIEHTEKQHLFERIFTALKSGGIFINIGQFEARSQKMHKKLVARWLRDVQAANVPKEDIAAARQRMADFDRNAPMESQFAWLEKAGFIDVDILYRNYFWAVFCATKPR